MKIVGGAGASAIPETKRVCIVTTTSFIANAFLLPHLRAIGARYDLTVALNIQDGYPLDPAVGEVSRVVHVPIERKVSMRNDLSALRSLTALFRKSRFDLVHSVAPKAGLLAMIAARIAGIRTRMHTFQGEVWASKRGAARAILKSADQLVGRLATHAAVVSHGEQLFLEQEGVLKRGRSRVLAGGSISGVDISRFRPNEAARAAVRQELGINSEKLLVMYLGRLARDKGVLDLAAAFAQSAHHLRNTHLVFVGPDEDGLRAAILSQLGQMQERLHFAPYTRIPERYLAAADLVCLPSYREGFSVSLIEAAACEVPVLASDLYGTRDVVLDGITGLFHQPGNIDEIASKLLLLANDAALRTRLGRAARLRVDAEFRTEMLVEAQLHYYEEALGA